MRRPALAVRPLVRIAVVVLVATTAGCGLGEPRSLDPQGVDGLEIPTPGPDPADFVAAIDNRFLPLTAGSRWVYERSGSDATLTVSVDDTTTEVAGVATTSVTTTGQGDESSTSYYAQDDDGNVWSFGGPDWQAGVDGAEAGLAMPATPRVGDGFEQQDAPGVAEGRSEVLDVAASASAPYDSWTDLVAIRESTPLLSTQTGTSYYAPGVGLVRTASAAGVVELVSYTHEDPAP